MITREKLAAVIESNIALQKRAQSLNIRSGQDVFRIMPQSELKTWLAERLNGARCIIEIPHLEDLYLPGLDQDLVTQVLADNPDEITVDGVTVPVEYGKDYYSGLCAKIELEEGRVRSTQLEKVTLPGGRDVTIVCGSHSAPTFAELTKKLEQRRIELAWSDARQSFGEVSNGKRNVEWFETALNKIKLVEVTKTDNGQGEAIYAYPGLTDDNYNDDSVYHGARLFESRQEAVTKTRSALQKILRWKLYKSQLTASTDEFENSEIRRAVQSTLDGLALDFAQRLVLDYENLNWQKVRDMEAELLIEVEEMKAEVGGRFVECQKAIEEAEVAVNTKTEAIEYDDQYFVSSELTQVSDLMNQAKEAFKSLEYDQVTASLTEAQELANSLEELVKNRTAKRSEAQEVRGLVSDDLYNLEYGYEDFGEAIAEEREQAGRLNRDINDAFSKRRYDEVVEKVEAARKLIETVRSTREERMAAKRAKYPDALWDAADNSEELIEQSIKLALAVVELLGEKGALYAISEEASANYGKDRRKDGIRHSVPGIEDTEAGAAFLEMYYADDIECMLNCAVAYLVSEGIELSEYDTRLAQLEQERDSFVDDVNQAEQDVKGGYAIMLRFRKGTHPKTGADQWEAGSSKEGIKYIVDSSSNIEIDPKSKYYCEIKRTLVNTLRFKLIVVRPYLATSRDFSAEIAALKAQHNVVDDGADDMVPEALDIEALKKAWGSN